METRDLFQSSAEHPDPLTIPIQGTLPEWFKGTYCSVGNGLFDLPSGFTVKHSYDGYSILYSVRVTNNKEATVMSKYLKSEAYTKAIEKGQPVFDEFGTMGSADPNKGFFSRVVNQLIPVAFTDNDFMNLIKLKGRIFVVSETCCMHQLNPESLESIQKVDLLKALGYPYLTAHPLYDHDGSTYWAGFSVGPTLRYNIIQFPPAPSNNKDLIFEEMEISSKNIKVIASIPSSWKTCFGYVHSFAITANYFILYEQPFRVNNLKVLTSHIQGRAIKDSFEWHPEEQTEFILVERLSGKTIKTKYLAPCLFITHIVNAYEEDGHIVLDLIGRKTARVVEHLSMENLRTNTFQHNDPPYLYRFVFPIIKDINEITSKENLVLLENTNAKAEKSNSHIFCTPYFLGGCVFDYPTINPKYVGKKHRYIYGTSYFEELVSKICKVDLLTKETQCLQFGEGKSLSEPYFVRRPDSDKEDDGVLIVSMSDTRSDHPSGIVYVDASTFKEIGRVDIPYKIAHIQHGMFLPN